MTIDQAREHLINLFKLEYHRYIRTRLAGDFAVTLVEKFEQKNNKKLKIGADFICYENCVAPSEKCDFFKTPGCRWHDLT